MILQEAKKALRQSKNSMDKLILHLQIFHLKIQPAKIINSTDTILNQIISMKYKTIQTLLKVKENILLVWNRINRNNYCGKIIEESNLQFVYVDFLPSDLQKMGFITLNCFGEMKCLQIYGKYISFYVTFNKQLLTF